MYYNDPYYCQGNISRSVCVEQNDIKLKLCLLERQVPDLAYNSLWGSIQE